MAKVVGCALCCGLIFLSRVLHPPGSWRRGRCSPASAFAMSAKCLLILLCATLYAPHDATAASLLPPQDQNSSAPAALQNNESDFYSYNGYRCKKCHPGNRIVTHCTIPETASQCQPCDRDTYFKYMNQLDKCLPCKICRDLDEVEIQPCTQTSDTECRCKNGTYCVPRLPCETCHRCTPSCPNGEKMEQPCTPTNNIKCVPLPTSPTPATATNVGALPWILSCSVVAVLVVLCVVIYKCKGRWSCSRGGNQTGTAARMWRVKTVQCLRRNCSQRQQEEHDNMLNAHVDPGSQQSHTSSSMTETLPLQVPSPSEEVVAAESKRNLIPANGRDPTAALSLSLEIFVKEVPVMQWRRYMRALGLTSNEIHTVAMSESHVNEQHFQMLQLWLDKNGRKATLDVLLQALCDIEHRGVEERVRRMLIDQGLYVCEEA
ncbi:tumor necrosis factor receptor superfamily member 10A-like [Varanus komodoensis]|uniref:tumor necrosis factor receptor superfamily member 10A-like n=1 Tax=Varanus komodoensis TaxID=61221 RepID=UPI001CF7D1AA|nr:tumor necrosis factor receptor superfamily member 10A-like [Varanus komodoensis]